MTRTRRPRLHIPRRELKLLPKLQRDAFRQLAAHADERLSHGHAFELYSGSGYRITTNLAEILARRGLLRELRPAARLRRSRRWELTERGYAMAGLVLFQQAATAA